MKYTVSIVHRANIHLTTAIEWCKEQNQGLEIEFLKAVDKAIEYIQKNPLKSQIRYREVRVKFIKKPKFGIHYILKENHIYIIGIFHTSQDSKKW